MITFINTFLTYLILVIVMGSLAVGGVFAGRKLRQSKDAKKALEAENKQ